MPYESPFHAGKKETGSAVPPRVGTEQPEIPGSPETKESEKKASDICQLGDYEKILATFALPENAGLLEEQIDLLRNNHGSNRLREASQHLEEHDWEMLTILELFDHTTFEHCLRTYETAHQKINSPEAVGAYLRASIEKEGFAPWDIELACLLHDMGKIALIPKDLILNNILENEEWRALFESFCKGSLEPEDAEAKISVYNDTLASHPELREKDITPLFVSLTSEERERLEASGIDTGLPLGKIIEKHQDISVAIAERYYPESAILELIGNHHERPLAPAETHPVSQSAVRVSFIINALRIADIFDAFRHSRPYKDEKAFLTTLAFLTKKADEGFIDDKLTYLWIDEELKKFDVKAYLHGLQREHKLELAEHEAASYETVLDYLSTFPDYQA